MAKRRNPDLLRGTVDVLLLKALSAGPRHGFAVARWLEERTEDVLHELTRAIARRSATSGTPVTCLHWTVQ